MSHSPEVTGPVFAAIDAVLGAVPEYRDFRAGALDRQGLNRLVDAEAKRLVARGIQSADLPFVKRLPASPRDHVRQSLAYLHRRGLIATDRFDDCRAAEIERMLASYEHGPYKTYIYPEEGLLLWALAEICRPKHAIFLGSYYGYWAAWTLPAIAAGGGRITLVDPDERSCAIAARNVKRAGLDGVVNTIVARGERFLADTTDTYDWAVLDAENPRDHPDPAQRGKRVYSSLTRACLPRLEPDALLVCHNILFEDNTGDPAFAMITARNRDELSAFMRLVEAEFDFFECATTEGVGVGRRRPGAAARA